MILVREKGTEKERKRQREVGRLKYDIKINDITSPQGWINRYRLRVILLEKKKFRWGPLSSRYKFHGPPMTPSGSVKNMEWKGGKGVDLIRAGVYVGRETNTFVFERHVCKLINA